MSSPPPSPQAVGVDSSDVTVWFQLAQASCNLGNLLLGRTALEEVGSVQICMHTVRECLMQARKCHTLYWPVIDLLSTVLFALEDYTGGLGEVV